MSEHTSTPPTPPAIAEDSQALPTPSVISPSVSQPPPSLKRSSTIISETPSVISEDSQPPPSLQRSSTPALDEGAPATDAATPPTIKRCKTVCFAKMEEDSSKKEEDCKTSAYIMIPEHSELIDALVDLLHSGKTTAAALLAVYVELKALPHERTSEPANEQERAFDHRIMLDKIREATVTAWKKAHIRISELPVIEVD